MPHEIFEDFYQDLLRKVLARTEVRVTFENLPCHLDELMKDECYKTLCRIKGILSCESFSDTECYAYIEAIISLYEEMGSGCGGRHRTQKKDA